MTAGFTRRNSLYFADMEERTEDIHEEYLLKKHNGFSVELIHPDQARDQYSFDMEEGLLCYENAATIDPYLLTHNVITAAEKAGARIYENTTVEDISQENGKRSLLTSVSHTVKADTVVLAIGLDSCDFLKGVGEQTYLFFCGYRTDRNAVRMGGRSHHPPCRTPGNHLFPHRPGTDDSFRAGYRAD